MPCPTGRPDRRVAGQRVGRRRDDERAARVHGLRLRGARRELHDRGRVACERAAAIATVRRVAAAARRASATMRCRSAARAWSPERVEQRRARGARLLQIAHPGEQRVVVLLRCRARASRASGSRRRSASAPRSSAVMTERSMCVARCQSCTWSIAEESEPAPRKISTASGRAPSRYQAARREARRVCAACSACPRELLLEPRPRQAAIEHGHLGRHPIGARACACDGGVIRVDRVQHLPLVRGQGRAADGRGTRAVRARDAGGRSDQGGHTDQPRPAQQGMRRHLRTLAKTPVAQPPAGGTMPARAGRVFSSR